MTVLAFTTMGEYTLIPAFGLICYAMYFLFGDANMHRHQVTGEKLWQELHTWFTISFLGVCWTFY